MRREGLEWADIDWVDNGECLDLIEKVSMNHNQMVFFLTSEVKYSNRIQHAKALIFARYILLCHTYRDLREVNG